VPSIELLRPADFARGPGRRLLWLAVEVGDDVLDAIVENELPQLTLLGVRVDRMVAFAAYRTGDHGTVLEYIAVDDDHRGQGLASTIIAEILRREPRAALTAQTDDDAVGFYRALGFAVVPRPPDPRWPDRQRYDCTLTPPEIRPQD
jgi:ribosomal protein S18 acetylase RimI-like enzyme